MYQYVTKYYRLEIRVRGRRIIGEIYWFSFSVVHV